MGKRKGNPFCPVPRCLVTAPHADDFIVQALTTALLKPALLAQWALNGMKELKDSLAQDIASSRVFAWSTRLRQIEELYIRTVYLLLLADDEEIPHFLSEIPPNGFTALYRRVNKEVLAGEGDLEIEQIGLASSKFTAMQTINQSAHVSFRALATAESMRKEPAHILPRLSEYEKHVERYCHHLQHMQAMFMAERKRDEVLKDVRSFYNRV
jgi:hypothetical protein